MRRLSFAALTAGLLVGGVAAADPPRTYKPSESGDSAVAPRAKGQPAESDLDDSDKTDDTRPVALTDKRPAPTPAPEPTKEPVVDKLPPSYGGVIPGGSHLPPHPPRLPSTGPVRMTWPGFQVRDNLPTVFLELTGAVEWSVSEQPKSLVYTLKNTTVPLRNNTRPLRVGAFKTAVESIDARPSGRDVRVTISLNQKVSHRESTEDAAGGFKMLVVGLTPRD